MQQESFEKDFPTGIDHRQARRQRRAKAAKAGACQFLHPLTIRQHCQMIVAVFMVTRPVGTPAQIAPAGFENPPDLTQVSIDVAGDSDLSSFRMIKTESKPAKVKIE